MTSMETSRSSVSIAVGHFRFVVRCATSATLAYSFARMVGLPHPVWAPISALIVSQEDLSATRSSAQGRFVGTLVGVLAAVLVHRLGMRCEISLTSQVAVAVAICAICAKERSSIRVCLWTAPLVLLTANPAAPTEITAIFRGSEVVIGAAVGSLLHIVEEWLLALIARQFQSACSSGSRAAGGQKPARDGSAVLETD